MEYGDQNVQCPYYRRRESSGRAAIVCEGLIGRTAAHRFSGNLEVSRHFQKYCCGRYQSCRYAGAMEKKWGE